MPSSSNKADPCNKLFLHDPNAEFCPVVYLLFPEVVCDRSLVLFFVEDVVVSVAPLTLPPLIGSFHCSSPFADDSFTCLLRISPSSLFILSTSSCVRVLPCIC